MLSFFRGLMPSLQEQGVLGINSRNIDFIFPGNPRKLFPQADNKLKTKEIANQLGVPVPQTYGVICFQNEVAKLSDIIENQSSFVIKPARGSGGSGILVISDSSNDRYCKPSGKQLSKDDVEYHIHKILSGMFSLSGHKDIAFIEETVQFDPIFDEIAYLGVPDLRIIVYRGVPTMAMLRLPSRASDGKANLHSGGLGVGIDMSTGLTLKGIQYNRYVTHHPDTGGSLADRLIPYWDKILDISARLGDRTEFTYLGVDIVLDKNRGPLLLEINARPGLSIQIANGVGLLPRLKKIDHMLEALKTVEHKIAFAQDVFRVKSIDH